MSQAFYNDLRNTRTAQSARSIKSASASRSLSKQTNTTINYEKREKLKNLLVTKFMKKFHLKTNEPFIEEEVRNFLHKETLTDNDLKRLENRIYELLKKKFSLNYLENELKQGNSNNFSEGNEKNEKRVQTAYTRKNDDDCESVKSHLSGASKLSKAKPRKKELDDEDLELLSECNEPVERINFTNEKDEWNAINKYNQQVFEEDKIKERLKDKEVKNRTKADLDNQIKQKLLLQNEERMKNKEYDKICIDHVQVMNRMEENRKRELREKMLREKVNRDQQMLDEKKRKKIEDLKKKKYDKELRKSFL